MTEAHDSPAPGGRAARDGKAGITGTMARLYDLFVDWEGRLAREMPGIRARLDANGARRVLDLGCGTGRHLRALIDTGYDAVGADASEDMLAEARELLGGDERLHAWRMGTEPPVSLVAAAPFDAALCMGNTWPQVVASEDLERLDADLRRLVRPGGLLLLGLKAMAIRRERNEPYLPLLRREREGRLFWFVRFVDLALPPLADGTPVLDLHVSVLAGDAARGDAEALHHGATRVRAWSPEELERWLGARGWSDARVSSRLDDPAASPTTEDVYASALAPRP